jgi:hypothetical protein
VPHAGNCNIVDEASFADEQRAVLEARNARSDQSTHVRLATLITLMFLPTIRATHKASHDFAGNSRPARWRCRGFPVSGTELQRYGLAEKSP